MSIWPIVIIGAVVFVLLIGAMLMFDDTPNDFYEGQ